MQPKSKRELFYQEVGEAMAMNNMKSFIDMDTLDVEIHSLEDEFGFSVEGDEDDEDDYEEDDDDQDDDEEEDEEDERSLDNPGKYFMIKAVDSSASFQVMEGFAESVRDKHIRAKLIQALEGKKPFANFKWVIDNSPVRQAWFDFRNNAYVDMAKEWIEKWAPNELKEKIKQLPAVFIA